MSEAGSAAVVDESGEGTLDETPRRTYELDETGFREVPKRWRKFYRHWGGPTDVLAPNEVVCPVCICSRQRARLPSALGSVPLKTVSRE